MEAVAIYTIYLLYIYNIYYIYLGSVVGGGRGMEERAPDCCQDRRSFDQNCGSRDRRRPAVNASRLFALSSSYDGEQLCMNSRFAKYNGRFPKM